MNTVTALIIMHHVLDSCSSKSRIDADQTAVLVPFSTFKKSADLPVYKAFRNRSIPLIPLEIVHVQDPESLVLLVYNSWDSPHFLALSW